MPLPFALGLLLLATTADRNVPIPQEDAADTLVLATDDTRMTVPVSIAGAGPYQFVIDTGAQRTVISRELAATLGLSRGRDVRLTAMTETSEVGTAIIPSISVSRLGGERIEAPALAQRHLGAPGMLGIDALQGHALSIDFDTNTMAVRPSSTRARARRIYAADEVVVQARNLFGQLVVTDARYRGTRIRVVLDTGSPVSIGNAALRKLVAKRAHMQEIALTSVTGGTLVATYTQIDRIELGTIVIENLPVAFADAAPFKLFQLTERPAILLGMDALALFRRVDIDFANRELRLTRQRRFPGNAPNMVM